MYLYFTNFRDE